MPYLIQTLTPILAQQRVFYGSWSFGEVLVALIVLAAVVAVFLIALRNMQIAIPPWVTQIIWVVGVAVLAILAIRFLLSL